ncbi:MAG TPA: GH92 family glycosyl hydrolase [Candidatus Hydrogenedentes bacterium]|nr:GH92 family glycosyl hydrolase [Candidatus Hydrogenedentota bacterium]
MKKWFKRVALVVGLAVLVAVLAAGVFAGALAFKYKKIVKAGPGSVATNAQPGELGRWVDPFIGTGGVPWMCANNYPGVSLPFGVVRLSPETVSMLTAERALNKSGYYYGDNKMLGFSHTRLNGTGAVDGGHFLVRPALAPVAFDVSKDARCDRFTHAEEEAFPGYYAVRLSKPGILAELTATPRVGVHRYTFPANRTAHVHIDVSNALGGRRSEEGEVRVFPAAGELQGSVRTFGAFAGRYGGIKVYFAARFDRPFSAYATWSGVQCVDGRAGAEGSDVGADLTFNASGQAQTVELRLAISHVSIANAKENLEAETAGKTFEAILEEAKAAWEERLSLIKIQGGSEQQRTIFYTALYRVFQMPTVFSDVNGDYFGFDKQVHRAEGFRYFTDMSLWDTFRTVHPLYTLIAPGDQRDMLVSLIAMAEQGGGWLPRWPSGNGYTNSMLGTPADIVISESYLKGIRGFDIETAYEMMRRTALGPTPKGAAFSGREGIEHYLEYKYCPADLMEEAVSRTFEFGWADSALANLAYYGLGNEEDAALFREHAAYYRNLWNPETRYFQPRTAAGAFVEPFDPLKLSYLDSKGDLTNDYVEGSALQWRWGAPYDARGMIDLFGSPAYFVDELTAFFENADGDMGVLIPSSYYWQGNQPDLHAAYLFIEALRADLTQKWVRWILDTKHSADYVGLDGNDDGGTLSAWFVFSALGLYPMAGTNEYWVGAPLFERADVKVRDGTLAVIADNYAPENLYAHSVRINGYRLDEFRVTHEQLARGGELRFAMAPEPAGKAE